MQLIKLNWDELFGFSFTSFAIVHLYIWTNFCKNPRSVRITHAGSWGYVIGVPYYVISRSYLRGVLIVCQKRGICRWGKIHQFYLQFWKQRTKIEVHKKKRTWHNQVQTSLRSILASHMKVTKIAQKHILWTFWVFLVMFISDIKIVHVKSEPHCVKCFFFETSKLVGCFSNCN